jgi:ABC-type nitrate/sulfonate/bicarbonate transport system substrate-binding protein
MLGGAGLTPDDVELVSVGFDPRVFIEGGVDVYPVFLNNEPNTIRNAGVEINVIDPHHHEVPTLGLTYLVRESMLEDGDAVERFLRATLRAVTWIEANPDEAIEVVLTHAEGADPEHQRFLLDEDLAAAQRDNGIGRASLEQWEALMQLLIDHDVIDAPIDVDTAWRGEVIDALYDGGEIE